MGTGSYHLKAGTLLDERYEIQSVIGEGGFGITYLAVSIHQDEKVAVKEFFWRDYVTRDTSVSDCVQLYEEEKRSEYERQKQKFLKEARIISDFSQEPGIVHVTDQFEGNGTAYIVMNFVEGQTLKKYMENQNSMEPETAFRMMLPLMEVLDKIHACGIIHRDISPDNLIVGADHSLTLIDFGAAKDYSKLTDKTYSIVLKGGYAPCEQYDRHGKLGPWTDVYALCAVIYFCITKNAPDDAFQRMLHDELKKPSELGISMNPALEKILMKGLALDISSRYQSARELMAAVREIIRETDPKEIRRRWAKRISAVFCALLLFAGAGYWYYMSHLADFKFRDEEIITVSFGQTDSLSHGDYQSAEDILAGRLDVLLGENNYIIEKTNEKTMEVTMPLAPYQEILENSSEHYIQFSDFIWQFLACPGKLSINDLILTEDTVKDAQIKKGRLDLDIETSEYQYTTFPKEGDYYYLEITVEDEYAELIQKYREENPTGDLSFSMDWEEMIEGQEDYTGMDDFNLDTFWENDYQTFYLTGWIQDKDFYRLLLWDIYHEPYESNLSYSLALPAAWEDTDSSMMAGENQVNEDDIPDPAVYLEYNCSPYNLEMSNGQWYNLISDFKTALDSLEIPYAIGISAFQDRDIILKIPEDKLYLELMSLLVQKGISLGIREKTVASASYNFSETSSLEKTGGSGSDYSWIFQDSNEYSLENIQERSEEILASGLNTIYLFFSYDTLPIAYGQIQEPITDGKIRLTEFPVDFDKIKKETYFQFIHTLAFDVSTSASYSLGHIHFTSADGGMDMDADADDYRIMEGPQFAKLKEEAEKIDPEIQVEEDLENHLTVTLPYDSNGDLVKNFLETAKTLFKNCGLDNMYYGEILFRLPPELVAEKKYLNLSFYSRYDKPNLYSLSANLGEAFAESYAKELEQALRTDDFFSSYIDENFEIQLPE